MDSKDIRNRIIGYERIRLGDIDEHPLNYKVHTEAQGETLDGVVADVGWIGVPLVYRSAKRDGRLTYVDGHLRARRFPDLVADVAILDLSDAEADLALLTYDPIAAMAGIERDRVLSLLENVEAQNAATQVLLAKLASDEIATLATTTSDEISIVPPEDFKEYDEDLETEYCCPKCGYKWSGKPG